MTTTDCGDRRKQKLEIPAELERLRETREWANQVAADHGLSEDDCFQIKLAMSEAVTNAIIHPRPGAGEPAIHVHLVLTDAVEIVVANNGSADTIPPVDEWRPAPATAPSGRGLGIVRRLCDNVTVEQRGGRAVITCRRRLPDGGAKP